MSEIAEDKVRAKRERIMASAKGSGEPSVNKETYKLDLCSALNYYSTFEDNKTKRKWVKTFLTKEKMTRELDIVNSTAPDYLFNQIGSIMRLKSRGQYISQEHWDGIMKRLYSIEKYLSESVSEDSEVKQPKTVDRNKILVEQCMDAINERIDDFIISRKISPFNLKAHFTANNTPTVVIKKIQSILQDISKELASVNFNDEEDQMTEGYSNFTKRELGKYQELIDEMVNACSSKKESVRKQRKTKAKPASALVSKVKYLPSITIGGIEIKSIKPENIVKSKEFWAYDTVSRKMYRYTAGDSELSVVRSKVVGYDETASNAKRLRKPETFFTSSLAKKSLNDSFDKLTTIDLPVSGRITDKMILVRAF